MSDFEIVGEPVVLDDGTEYRALIQRMDYADEPYDDGAWPILRLDYSRYSDVKAQAFNKQAEPYVMAWNELNDRLYGSDNLMRAFGLWVKLYHGGTRLVTYGRENTRQTDHTYLAFDTAGWREKVGAPLENMATEDPLSEVRAWIEGDVYGITVQHRWNPDNRLDDPDVGWHGHGDGWTWGYYGDKYAEEEAKQQLENAVADHKPVTRYREHEKLEAIEGKVSTITDFLEGIGQGAGKYGYSHVLAAITGSSPYNGNHLEEVPSRDYQKIVFEFFGIDYDKIQEEREAMYRALSILNQPEEATNE